MKTNDLIQTGSQTVGPFFHYALVSGIEHILVKEETQGQHILITGTVLDGDQKPVPDALIEIWQADSRGYFNHPADQNSEKADQSFRGFGRSDTTEQGVFSFKTIKPGVIAGSAAAPFINVRVFARGMLIHVVTRLYFSDEEANANDRVLSSVDPERRQTLIAVREVSNEPAHYRFDIHLQGGEETVFFNV